MAVYCKTQAQADAEMLEWLQQALGVSMSGPWGNQCVKVSQQYSQDLFGISPYSTLGYGNAIDHITNANKAYFAKIWNDPTKADLLPSKGDVMVWNGKPLWDGKLYGHTGVTHTPNRANVKIVQQDGAAPPTKLHSDGYRYSVKPAHYGTFAYVGDRSVGDSRGWLRPNYKKVVYTGADTRLGLAKAGQNKVAAVVTPTSPAAKGILDWIDISNHQPASVLETVKTDAVIIKATEGVGWEDKRLRSHVAVARKRRIPYMLYHFARATLNSSDAEAKWFDSVAAAYRNDPLFAGLVLDFEEDAVSYYGQWGDDFIRWFWKNRPNIPMALYTRANFLKASGWTTEVRNRTPVWIAAYGTDQRMNGYATSFAGAPSVAGWSISAWQYSQRGRLPGYGGDLDLNRTLSGRVPLWNLKTTGKKDDDQTLEEWIVNNEQKARKMMREEISGTINHLTAEVDDQGRKVMNRIRQAASEGVAAMDLPGLGAAEGNMSFKQSKRHERDERGKNVQFRKDTRDSLDALAEALAGIVAVLPDSSASTTTSKAPEAAEERTAPQGVVLTAPDGTKYVASEAQLTALGLHKEEEN